MEANPLVSICIPTYNGAEFLKEALKSALTQSYRPLEIVISDDDSKDETLEIVNSYHGRTEVPIRIFKHKPAGIGANWNNSVNHAKGEYIKFLFQDDVMRSDCIEKMMGLALSDSGLGIVFSLRDIIVDKHIENEMWVHQWLTNYSSLHTKWPFSIQKINHGGDLLKSLTFQLLGKNIIGEPTCTLIKKSTIEKCGGFNTKFKQLLDIEAWYRIMANHKIGFIEEKLVSFRLHKTQQTFKNSQLKLQEKKLFKDEIYQHVKRYLNPKTKIKLFLERRFGFVFSLLTNSLHL